MIAVAEVIQQRANYIGPVPKGAYMLGEMSISGRSGNKWFTLNSENGPTDHKVAITNMNVQLFRQSGVIDGDTLNTDVPFIYSRSASAEVVEKYQAAPTKPEPVKTGFGK